MKNILSSSRLLLLSSFLLLLAFAAPAARGEYLYFLVDAYSQEGPLYNFDYAVLGVADSDGAHVKYLSAVPGADTEASPSQVFLADSSGTYSNTHEWLADITGYADPEDGYLFYIETYKFGSKDPIWGYNEETAQSFAQLASAHHIMYTDLSEPNLTAWTVPEPTSGMLVLLGLATLALRRKREERK